MDERERLAFLGWASTPKFKAKVNRAIAVIEKALAIAPAYVACSWGKDSVVLLHLCQRVKKDIPIIYWPTPYQDLIDNFSEVRDSYLERYQSSYREMPYQETKKNTRQQSIESGLSQLYPLVFIGLRADESINRKRTLKKGLIRQYKSGTYRACPIGFWNYQDIWAYIIQQNLPYLSGYDKIEKGSPKSRSTSHISKSNNMSYQVERWEYLKKHSPEFVKFIEANYSC